MNFQGNQLNYLDTMFRIGYAVFLIVSRLQCNHCVQALTGFQAVSIDFDEHAAQILASTPGARLGCAYW